MFSNHDDASELANDNNIAMSTTVAKVVFVEPLDEIEN